MIGPEVPDDEVIGAAILHLAGARAPASICPSEAARAVAPDPAWRALMPRVRAVAARLVVAGRIVATQRGAPVDALAARGPIRLSLRAGAGD